MSRRELLIGCGSRRDKLMQVNGQAEWDELTTLDINPDHKPHVVWDLMKLPLPFENDAFDEIHAYEVLEHTGQQGDYKFFFAQFSEFWRILKPKGVLFATVPARDSIWAWGDPSHTRIISQESLVFLKQPNYTDNIGKNAMSDFRNIYKADFDIIFSDTSDGGYRFAIQAIKPSRISYAIR
jgi:SAM-dependent methyltransferase